MNRLEDKQRKMRNRWSDIALRNPCECPEVVRLRKENARLTKQGLDIGQIVIDCLLEMEPEQHKNVIKRYRARKSAEAANR